MVSMSILESKQIWRRSESERRRLPHTLSQGQRENVRRALNVLRMRHGRRGLAARMGFTYDGMLKTLKRTPTMRVAVLVAFVSGASIKDVLVGNWPIACPHCGRYE